MASRAITVSILGRSMSQILLAKESELESNLSHVRDLLISQEVVSPSREFGFLTPVGNEITNAQENLLTLREIASAEQSTNKKASPTEPFEDLCESSIVHPEPDTDTGNKLKMDDRLLIRIFPKIKEEASGSFNGKKEDVHSGQNKQQTDNDKSSQVCQFTCPFRGFKDVFNIHDHITVRTLIKASLVLVFLLVCFTFLAVFAMHTLATTWGMLDMVGHHGNHPSGTTGVESRLQRVELVLEYKMAELEKRLADVEGSYLKDLKVAVQDMNEIKASLTGGKYMDTWNSGKDKKKDKDGKRNPVSKLI